MLRLDLAAERAALRQHEPLGDNPAGDARLVHDVDPPGRHHRALDFAPHRDHARDDVPFDDRVGPDRHDVILVPDVAVDTPLDQHILDALDVSPNRNGSPVKSHGSDRMSDAAAGARVVEMGLELRHRAPPLTGEPTKTALPRAYLVCSSSLMPPSDAMMPLAS